MSDDADGEAALARIHGLCGTVLTKGQELRQPLPSAVPPEDLSTLMQLLDLSLQTLPKLGALARAAAAATNPAECAVVGPCAKGIRRALQKVAEDYDGDYTRLLDYARVTVVAESLATLEKLLAWCLSPDRAPRFAVCRIKDRLSRDWDAEMSGGNRDVMLNGWLELGGGRRVIVEVQLHLRVLFEHKSDLHVLYDGARVLGAMEDSCARHEGALTDAALQRVERGVVRKLEVPFSPIDAASCERLSAVLKKEPCALLKLDLRYATREDEPDASAFQDWTLHRLLCPPVRTLACRRLRTLRLMACGLGGALPEGLRQMRALVELDLQWNMLTGSIPDWVGDLASIKVLYLDTNFLEGPIPDAVGELANLEKFTCFDNRLSGVVPADALARCSKLAHVRLGGQIPQRWRDRWTDAYRLYRTRTGTLYETGGNEGLTITAAGKAKLEAVGEANYPGAGLKSPLWPRVVG